MSPPPDNPLLCRIGESVIGDDQVMWGPFGPRRVTYADYTASRRALGYLEQARLILAAAHDGEDGENGEAWVDEAFEHLRWFELPQGCLT